MEQALCSPHTNILVTLILYTLSFPLIITPGLVIGKQILEKNILPPKLISLFCFGLISLFGYLFFLIFNADVKTAKIIGFLPLFIVIIFYCKKSFRNDIVSVLSHKDIYIPLLLMFIIGLFYLSIINIGYIEEYKCAGKNLSFIANRLFGEHSSPDYLIQKWWIDNLFNGRSPWGLFVDPNHGKTLLSDRPPMLAGIVLIYYSWVPPKLGFHFFMAMTTTLSLSWIPAMWAILRTAKLPLLRSLLFIFTLSQTYYFLYTSVYTWPKALSGALLTGAFILLILEPILTRNKPNTKAIVLGSIFGGLSIMTHNSTILVLIPLCLMLITPRLFPGVRLTIVGFTIVGIILLPWVSIKSSNEYSMSNISAYTLSTPAEEPMPDKFLRLSAYEAAKISYSKLTIDEIINNKINNLKSIISIPNSLNNLLDHQENHVFPIITSLQLFNIAWLLLLFSFMFNLLKKENINSKYLEAYSPVIRKTVAVSGILSISALIVFAMINFRGGVSNIATSGIPILLFSLLGLLVFSLRIKYIIIFVILQILYFYFIIINKILNDNLIILPEMVVLCVTSSLLLICSIYRARNIFENNNN